MTDFSPSQTTVVPSPGVRPCCIATRSGIDDEHATDATVPRNVRAFRRMQSLAGEWHGRADEKEVFLTYEVTGKDSAVVERYRHFFKGKMMEDEMLTVYHLDGDDLVLTHYCTLGNQPRMRAKLDDAAPHRIAFEFTGASNLPHPDALRMSGVTFEFADAGHVLQTWFWNGKKCYIKPENRSDDFDDIPDDGLGYDTFKLTRTS